MNTKTVVLGLDGAHFELIQPWIENGHLPNFEAAIGSGVSADLLSVLPPTTSPNWKAYATGKNPGKFGIFWWENVDTQARRVYYPSHRKRAHREFWDLIGKRDRVGVIGVPLTYPPRSLNGVQISGGPDGENSEYAYPRDLESYLQREYDYKVLREHKVKDEPDRAAQEVLDLIDLRFTVAQDLLKRYGLDFLQVTTFYLNTLHHYFWDKKQTRKAWERIDDYLGTFLDRNYNVVVMSDHGSNRIMSVFHVNTWLEESGYLETTKHTTATTTLDRLGLHSGNIKPVLSAFGLTGLVKSLVPDRFVSAVPNPEGVISRFDKANHVDWEATQAIASGQGPIYITEPKDSTAYQRIRTQLMAELMDIETPDGAPVVSDVRRGEDIYSMEYPREVPDLVVDQAKGIHIPGSVGSDKVFTAPREKHEWVGENKRAGLFVAHGPAFSEGTLESLSILDLAPTLLHLHGCRVPTDMDGSVRKEVFANDSEARTRDVSTRSVGEREQERAKIRAIARQKNL